LSRFFENVDTPRDDTGVAVPLPEITGDRTKEEHAPR